MRNGPEIVGKALLFITLCLWGGHQGLKMLLEAISLKTVSAKEFFLTQIQDGMHCLG